MKFDPALLPQRMRSLRQDHRGYPVPFFVAWVDDKPDFRVTDPTALARACTHNLCWICGKSLGRFAAFVGGPLVAAQGLAAEPPSHRECACFAAQVCPFLVLPRASRREASLPAHVRHGAIHVPENPGIAAVCMARGYRMARQPGGGFRFVFTVAEVLWFQEGRPATADEVRAASVVGLERYRRAAADHPTALAQAGTLAARLDQLAALVPAAVVA